MDRIEEEKNDAKRKKPKMTTFGGHRGLTIESLGQGRKQKIGERFRFMGVPLIWVHIVFLAFITGMDSFGGLNPETL